MKIASFFYYFIFVLAIYLGFFRPSTIGGVNDILFFPLLVIVVPKIYKFYKSVDKLSKRYILIWTIFIAYFGFILYSSQPLPGDSKMANMRTLYPYFFFFICIRFVNSPLALKKFMKAVTVMVFIAVFFNLVQSVYGAKPIFDPDAYYNIGHWAGQDNLRIGPLTRVILPTLYLVYVAFIFIVVYLFFFKSFKFTIISIILLLPIFIGYTRSHWLAIVVAIVFTLLLLSFLKAYKPSKLLRNALFVIVLLIISFNALSFINSKITDDLLDRVSSSFSDYSSKSGTYATRVDNSQIYLLQWFAKGFWTGADPFFMGRQKEPELTDVGYVYVLVTEGLIGLILFIVIWITSIIYGIRLIKNGRVYKSKIHIVVGSCLIAAVLFFIVSQQYSQFPYTTTLFASICGVAVSFNKFMKVYYPQNLVNKSVPDVYKRQSKFKSRVSGYTIES